MKIVIQCAGKKADGAGSFRTADGRRVRFVAHPEFVDDLSYVYAHPDEKSDDGQTWRERLLSYNRDPQSNPLRLRRAFELYQHAAYRELARRFGTRHLFILSAGWGLIPADFLTPDYDITFSSSGNRAVRRSSKDTFLDWAVIDGHNGEPLVFVGGKSYLPHFCRLTEHYEGPRIALYDSQRVPERAGVRFVRYPTTTRTNWHYGAARGLMDGGVDLDGIR
jgi:hypothetical protein